jgi:hypothetical protein
MSYILYSSIARAGGIDLLMGIEAVSHAPDHRFNRPRALRRDRRRLAALRRRSGQALIRLGEALTRRGRRWAPPACGRPLALAGE